MKRKKRKSGYREAQKFFYDISKKRRHGDKCILWPFATIKSRDQRYVAGAVKIDGKVIRIPRFLCEARHGPPPTPNHEAAHSCGNGHLACINPRHVRWKTHLQNVRESNR